MHDAIRVAVQTTESGSCRVAVAGKLDVVTAPEVRTADIWTPPVPTGNEWSSYFSSTMDDTWKQPCEETNPATTCEATPSRWPRGGWARTVHAAAVPPRG